MNVKVHHVTPMPLVPIPMVASPVPAMMATLAMDSLVIVRLLFTTKIHKGLLQMEKHKSHCVLIKGALLPSFTKIVSCDKFTLTHSFVHLSLSLILSPDIDECSLGTDMCHSNATCTDTDGSYTCSCKTGFSGDGFNCSSKKEHLNLYFMLISFSLKSRY